MGYDFELEGAITRVEPVHDGSGRRLRIGDRTIEAVLAPGLAPGEHWLETNGQRERVFVASRDDVHFVHWRGRVHRVAAVDALERARAEAAPAGGAEVLSAPMPGTVIEVAVAPGNVVEAGALLLTIESMKLETAITAPHAARVEEVCRAVGATFDQGDALVRLAPVDDAGSSAAPPAEDAS